MRRSWSLALYAILVACDSTAPADECPHRAFRNGEIVVEETVSALRAIDVDGDLDGDLVLALQDAQRNELVVLRQIAGGYERAGSVPMEANVEKLAVGDISGDGRDDLVVSLFTNGGGGAIDVLFGTAAGALERKTDDDFHTGGIGAALAADFNGDGFDDVAYPSGAAVYVFLGEAAGFATGSILSSGLSESSELAPIDLDEDGHLDLVLLDADFDLVELMKGTGEGTFHVVSFDDDLQPESILGVGDYNGDDHQDLVVVGNARNVETRRLGMVLFLNDGAGRTTSQPIGDVPAASENAWSSAVADLDADGMEDLAVANGRWLSISWGAHEGALESKTSFELSSTARAIDVLDANNDSVLDLVIAGDDVRILHGCE